MQLLKMLPCQGYLWREKIDGDPESTSIIVENFKVEKRHPKTNELLKVYNSPTEAVEQEPITLETLFKCIQYGSLWNDGKWTKEGRQVTNKPQTGKKVLQIHPQSGRIVNEYVSAAEASRQMKLDLSGLSKAARRHGKYSNTEMYFWRYEITEEIQQKVATK